VDPGEVRIEYESKVIAPANACAAAQCLAQPILCGQSPAERRGHPRDRVGGIVARVGQVEDRFLEP
jgi:hypothetical protein